VHFVSNLSMIAAMAETSDTTRGAVVAGYEIERPIGRGGMGRVYRAFDARLERPVALKLLTPRLAEDEAFRERLLRESRLAASLDHPNVVPVYDAGEANGTLFIAMRYVDGTDLRELIRTEGPLAPERAIAIATQVAGALDAAHARGLVHRDVKPSNVLIDRGEGREHCYLADFGLTQSMTNRPVTDGELLGTVDYVAPEQIRGDPVDGRADVYALGCLVYEALTGELPFGRSSDVATIFAHLEEEPVPASERRPELPAEIDAVLARAMAKDREARYETCGALVEEARAALGVAAPPAGISRRLAGVLVIVALLVVGALVAALLLTRGSASAEPATGSLVGIDAVSEEVRERVTVAAKPSHVVIADGQVWFAASASLWRLDPSDGTPVHVETVGAVYDLASLGSTVFLAREGKEVFSGVVVPYEGTGFRGDGVDVLACSLAADPSIGLWAAGCPNVVKIELEAGNRLRVGKTTVIPMPVPESATSTRWCLCDMTVGEGSLWVVGDAGDPRVWRIGASGEIEATIVLPVAPRSIAVTGGSAWVSAPLDDVVVQIDAETNRVVRQIQVGRGAAGVVAGGNAVWIANQLDGTISRIDPATARVTNEVTVGGRPTELAFGDGTVWATVDERS
jgi:serine/threonine-protein kinase